MLHKICSVSHAHDTFLSSKSSSLSPPCLTKTTVMENYTYNSSSYPDSVNSSPRSREIDVENSSPWDEQTPQQNSNNSNSKLAKFLCSYGGKIDRRPHDNVLSYIGGDTKILSVERPVRFSTFLSRLSSLVTASSGDSFLLLSFKYQLPGEDLDALISVTNDDDLEHMMLEYDRLLRGSPKPARMRLFLFPVDGCSLSTNFGSESDKSERDQLIRGLKSGGAHGLVDGPTVLDKPGPGKVEFLLGLEKSVPVQPHPAPVRVPGRVPDLQDLQPGFLSHDDQARSDLSNMHAQLHNMRIRELETQQQRQDEERTYGTNSNENIVGDYFFQRQQEKLMQQNFPGNSAPAMSAPGAFWPEEQVPSAGFPLTIPPPSPARHEQPMYMVSGPGGIYRHHPPAQTVINPLTAQSNQGYYVQRIGGTQIYRDQYAAVQPVHQQLPVTTTAGTIGVVRNSGTRVAVADTGYTQVAYDNGIGRQVHYNALSGGGGAGGASASPVVQYGVIGGGVVGHDGKVVAKGSHN